MIVANCWQKLPLKQGREIGGGGDREEERTRGKKPIFSFLVENTPFSEEKHTLCTGPKAHSLRRGHEHQLRKASVNAKFPFYTFGSHAIESPGPVGHLLLSLPSGGCVSYLPALKGLVLAQLAPSHAPLAHLLTLSHSSSSAHTGLARTQDSRPPRPGFCPGISECQALPCARSLGWGCEGAGFPSVGLSL